MKDDLKRFLDYILKQKNYSPNTAKNYEIDILDGKVNTVPLPLILNKIGFPANWRNILTIK